MIMDVIKQGSRARALGRPRDACPHPADSRERRAWYEGYDGSTWDFAERVPHPAVVARGPAARNGAVDPTLG
ncbi:ribosome modulation factor [Methylorubrum rhodinum]|uniref:Ribosome modulation factor n=1 Tax=Methylorubrum rhodinum TaxID=29428 RepID=A0A840ZK61_9HYPH|nr:Rmf/CrpP family protein [Methylorubrum rhodinum]MBB5758389.1 ribosome modulation factor [Methylorubrum rhodinum]